jgi:hypothetical protein
MEAQAGVTTAAIAERRAYASFARVSQRQNEAEAPHLSLSLAPAVVVTVAAAAAEYAAQEQEALDQQQAQTENAWIQAVARLTAATANEDEAGSAVEIARGAVGDRTPAAGPAPDSLSSPGPAPAEVIYTVETEGQACNNPEDFAQQYGGAGNTLTECQDRCTTMSDCVAISHRASDGWCRVHNDRSRAKLGEAGWLCYARGPTTGVGPAPGPAPDGLGRRQLRADRGVLPTEPTCIDGVLNGDESDIDCGGSCNMVSCDWVAGNFADASVRRLGQTASTTACARLVLGRHPNATGALYSSQTGRSNCYAAYLNSEDFNSSTDWQVCQFISCV